MSSAPSLLPENTDPSGAALCGVWVDGNGAVRLAVRRADGSRAEQTGTPAFFAWLAGENPLPAPPPGARVETLEGGGAYTRLAVAVTPDALDALLRAARAAGIPADTPRPPESHFLMWRRARLFAGMSFGQLRRCQLDIETDSADGAFSDASKPGDRVLAIGLRFDGRERTLLLETPDDAGERALLERLNAVLAEEDPDTIEGHNLFKFDLDYLRQRAKRLRVPCAWGRFGLNAVFRKSRLQIAERRVDFPRCDLPGRTVVDTWLLAMLHDITARELTSLGLKEVAAFFGVTDTAKGRTLIAGPEIRAAFRNEREKFLAYLSDDLRETAGVADILLPAFFEQTKVFPLPFQDAMLRGTAGKIDLLLLEPYLHARRARPAPSEAPPFEGGYTRAFASGVFKNVLHFDVASLYPSLLLKIGRNPRGDSLGVFTGLLRRLRDYRLECKQRARTEPDPEKRREYGARQAAFKILINSFYGYLAFPGARFGDGALAAEVTREGRELLRRLMDEFERLGCRLIEADTDGLYVSSETFFPEPEKLLGKAAAILPDGIGLEFDGRYDAMFCHKAKNYALRAGSKITVRGSALRSRGTEPFLKRLTDALVRSLLGAPAEPPLALAESLRRDIAAARLPVAELAKSETLGMGPEAYEAFVAAGGKPRRAAAEAALLMRPRPAAGERVRYFIAAGDGRLPDWRRARPLEAFDPDKLPYDTAHYTARLDDWLKRNAPFLEDGARGGAAGEQGELF